MVSEKLGRSQALRGAFKEGHGTSGVSPTNGFVNKVNLLHHSVP